ncbi:MAG: hypothetical protein V1840_00360 [Candidatus Omnitrophota bacterium]
MDAIKSKSIRNLEQKMAGIEPGSLRYQVLEASKKFKSSWIELGRILYGVYKDKHFKTWGYLSFEAYCQTEVGIQKQTAGKLIHSYYFLEKDEPELLKGIHADGSTAPKNIPSLEAVNVLRLAAKNKELTEDDYQDFKKSVFEDGKDGKEVKKQVGLRLRSLREEEDPQKARALRRTQILRRLYATLRTLEKEVNSAHLVSDRTSKELEKLLGYLESEIGDTQ